jgi:S1-C subfamily serine protease
MGRDKPSPSSGALWLSVAVAVVAAVSIGGTATWIILSRDKDQALTNSAEDRTAAKDPDKKSDEPKPGRTLEELKAATVFIKVALGPLHATGSGFLIRSEGNTGYVVTNAHVIDPEPPNRPRRGPSAGRGVARQAPQINLVFWSGTKQEQSARAEAVAVDPEQDLAVLQVTGVANLPRPIDARSAPKLAETLPVTIYGFPFGEMLALQKGNPAITVGRGSISSVRRNEREEPVAVQIDGALNPGNSGGPVLDAEGRLVGVAVATIRGAGIGLAIPAAEVTRMLDGRVGAVAAAARSTSGATAEVEVFVQLIDPLKRIGSVAIHYRRTDLVKDNLQPDKDGNWPELPGSQRVQLRIEPQKMALGTVQVPAADQQKPFTFQAVYVNSAGRRMYTQPRSVALLAQGAPVVMQPNPNRPNATPPFPVNPPPSVPKPPVATRPIQPSPPVAFQPQLPKLAREEVPLPGTVSDVAVGGGGRYLILYLAGQKKLAVFDVKLGRVAKYLPAAEEIIHFAAGANRLAVVYPNAKLIQLWNLESFAKERTAPLPASLTGDDIHQICMGSASAGPLFVYLPREKRTLALELTGLTTTEVRWTHWSPSNAYGPLHMRASPDGTMLLGWAGGWAGMAMALFDGGKQVGVFDKFEFSLGIFALPSADGRLIFTPWAIVGRDLTPTKVPELQGKAYLVPAHEPGYFLALYSAGNRGLPNSPYGKKAPANLPPVSDVAFYTDDRKRLVALNEFNELKEGSALYWEQRVHYYPRAGLLVTLAKQANGDRLVLRNVDLVDLMNKAGIDYLFVASQVPPAKAGATFTYRLDIRSKKGGVRVKLESGPKGMQVTPEGLVTWAVPAGYGEPEADVLLTINDASGQEMFHNFKIMFPGL